MSNGVKIQMFIMKVKRLAQIMGVVLVAAWLTVSAACSTATTTATVAPASSATVQSPVATAAPGNTVTINLVTENMAFDTTTITVKAGSEVVVNMNNKDRIGHNLAVYTDQSASQVIFKGEIFGGPATRTFTFTAPSTPGTYFFRCDPHPSQMKGQFIVQ
jgi:plastocyanin